MTFAPAGPFLSTCAALGVAFACGGVIGLERQIRQRSAGLRTMVLVCIGSAAFVDFGGRIFGADGLTRVMPYVVSGIGFLGAGVIMKEGVQVRGLNTAATLWATAAVGCFAGGKLYPEAGVLTVFVIAGNTLLRPLVDWINRRPVADFTEAVYQVHVLCASADVGEVREILGRELEKARYPVQATEALTETEEQVELAATLIPTSADVDELEAVCRALEAHPEIQTASWTVSAML